MSEQASPIASGVITAPPDEQANMQIAFTALLATRRPTFLARYPRNLKVAIVVLLLWAVIHGLIALLSTSAPPAEQADPSLQDVLAQHATKPLVEAEEKKPRPPVRAVDKVEPKTEAEKAAAAFNDSQEPTQKMAVAPDLALIEETSSGRLPKISVDGRKPWQVYARPFNSTDPRPRIAIVIGDLGLSRVATDATLRRLPPTVTLAFDVQAPSIESWLQRARQDGHETLLSLPMEPYDYPRSDPGPNSLLTTLPNADNIQRMIGFLRLGTGYVGVTTLSGSRFSSDSTKLMPILSLLRDRGLLILDTRITNHSAIAPLAQELQVPMASSSIVLDGTPTPQSIDDALAELEQTARYQGSAIGLASPLPVTLDRIETWSKTLAERGLVLAPVSALVR